MIDALDTFTIFSEVDLLDNLFLHRSKHLLNFVRCDGTPVDHLDFIACSTLVILHLSAKVFALFVLPVTEVAFFAWRVVKLGRWVGLAIIVLDLFYRLIDLLFLSSDLFIFTSVAFLLDRSVEFYWLFLILFRPFHFGLLLLVLVLVFLPFR